jgi:hypothetical protein
LPDAAADEWTLAFGIVLRLIKPDPINSVCSERTFLLPGNSTVPCADTLVTSSGGDAIFPVAPFAHKKSFEMRTLSPATKEFPMKRGPHPTIDELT